MTREEGLQDPEKILVEDEEDEEGLEEGHAEVDLMKDNSGNSGMKVQPVNGVQRMDSIRGAKEAKHWNDLVDEDQEEDLSMDSSDSIRETTCHSCDQKHHLLQVCHQDCRQLLDQLHPNLFQGNLYQNTNQQEEDDKKVVENKNEEIESISFSCRM